MSQELAVLSVQSVTYVGGGIGGSSFSVTFGAGSETTVMPLSIPPGTAVTINEILTAMDLPSASPALIPLTITAATVPPGGTGTNSTTISYTAGSGLVSSSLTVMVGQPFGPPVTLRFDLTVRQRVYPTCCWNADFLCERFFYPRLYYKWLCSGFDYAAAVTLNPVVQMTSLVSQYQSKLAAINTELSFNFSPASSSFLDRVDAAMKTVVGTSVRWTDASWRSRINIDDFYTAFEGHMVEYVGIYPREWHLHNSPLCNKWFNLLNCFCKICAQRPILPSTVVVEYDAHVAPKIDALYPYIGSLVAQQSMPMPLPYIPPNQADQCAKLRYIISYFSCWCIVCYDPVPVNPVQLETHYQALYPSLGTLNQMLTELNIYICDPPEQNFCTRWLYVLNCLSKICRAMDDLPFTMQTQFYNTFHTLVDSIHGFLHLPYTSEYQNAFTLCNKLSEILSHFQRFICGENAIVMWQTRRGQLDNYLVQIEAALNSYKTLYGDLCQSSTSTGEELCDGYLSLMTCLKNLCDHQDEWVDDFGYDLETLFFERILDLYELLSEEDPETVPPGEETICARIALIYDYFVDLCADGHVDPVLKIRLEGKLAILEDRMDILSTMYQDLCQPTVPFTSCNDWLLMLNCLKKLCDIKLRLNEQIIEDLCTNFGPAITYLYWLVTHEPGEPFYDPESYPMEDVCAKLQEILAYFDTLCPDGEVSPLRKLKLDQEIDRFVTAYNTLLGLYPGICSSSGPGLTACTDWIRVMDCFMSICDRRAEISAGGHGVVIDTLSVNVHQFEWLYSVLNPSGTIPSSLISTERVCWLLHEIMNWFAAHCACGAQSIDPTTQDALDNLFSDFDSLLDYIQNLAVGVDLCRPAAVSCDRLIRIARFAELFCCRSTLSSTPVTAVTALVEDFFGVIPDVVLQTGQLPEDTSELGSDFCTRLRYALSWLTAAYASYGSLTPLLRRRADCFYDGIQEQAIAYEDLLGDLPRPCGDCFEYCSKWTSMLACLCTICSSRSSMPSQVVTAFDAQVCPQIGQVYSYVVSKSVTLNMPIRPTFAITDCCERLRQIIAFFSILCLDRENITPEMLPTLEGRYTILHNAFIALPGYPGLCATSCDTWISTIECLAQIIVRKGEIPPATFAPFLGLLAGPTTALHTLVVGTGTTSPVPSNVLDPVYWKLIEVLRKLHVLCSPYRPLSPTLRNQIQGLFPPFQAALGIMSSQAAAAGITPCGDNARDICERLRRIADLYTLFCITNPDTSLAPVSVLSQFTATIESSLSGIVQQLGITSPAQPNAAFCIRFKRLLDVIAVAYSRYAELARANRIIVDFIYGIVQLESAAYATLIAGSIPNPSDPIAGFRRDWMEVLNCLCKFCANRKDFAVSYPNIVGVFDDTVGPVLSDLYYTIVGTPTIAGLAQQAGLPIIAASCTPDLCAMLRVVISFFSTYCLGCHQLADQGVNDMVTQLEPMLLQLRDVTVALRGAMDEQNLAVCDQEADTRLWLQSPYLYLQAAGSSGSTTGGDGSTAGVHLRWSFLQSLGDSHLPKGNLASAGSQYEATYGFNRPDDFVRIYRAPYALYGSVIDFNTSRPDEIIYGESSVTWVFVLRPDPVFRSIKTTVRVVFQNRSSYNDTGLAPKDNSTHVKQIVQGYTGLIRVDAVDKLLFAFEVDAQNTSSTNITTRIEGISQSNGLKIGREFISCRRKFIAAPGPQRITSEGMGWVRFDCQGGYPMRLTVETYADFYKGAKLRYQWRHLGDFSLSIDQTEVYRRLQDTSHFTINNSWPKFNDAPSDPTSVGKVNVANYQNRWNPDPALHGVDPEHGIEQAVKDYLDLSKVPEGWEAKKRLRSVLDRDNDVLDKDDTEIELSMLKMLKLVAQDFHVARMLGFGHIDWQVPLGGDPSGQRYVYLMEYETKTRSGAMMMHRYLSLPTGRQDHRLPIKPSLLTPEPGLPAFDQNTAPYTNPEGYTKYGDSRFIRLNRAAMIFDRPMEAFFANQTEFSRGEHTRPQMFGITYGTRKAGTLDWTLPTSYNWVLPEVSNDHGEYEPDGYLPYTDNSSQHYPEPVSIPDRPEPPLFVHRIPKTPENEGVHYYGIYGINWFSRVSPVSVLSTPINNQFPKRNTLIPPMNMMSQYIQVEDPPLFTSTVEQNPAFDLLGKTRITFDWNHLHNIAYQQADRIEFFFRDLPPKRVRGRIDRIEHIDGTNRMRIITTSYRDMTSATVLGGEEIAPTVTQQEVDDQVFMDSIFATSEGQFVVRDVVAGTNAIFVLDKIYEPTADNKPDTGKWVGLEQSTYFQVVENVTRIERWGPLLGSYLKPVSFSNYYEDVVEAGRTVRKTIGGITATASIVPSTVVPGSFEITFGSAVLSDYPTADKGPDVSRVEWYKGVVRVLEYKTTQQITQSGPPKMKVLDVVKIVYDQAGPNDPLVLHSPTTIHVYDPELGREGSFPIAPSGGRSAQVNFHPSYRVYLDLPAAGINPEYEILPVEPGAMTRQTLLAARSAEVAEGNYSPLTPPSVQLARKIVEPTPPQAPVGPVFATRPDFYGKSTFTFDTTIASGDDTYAMMFYRANEVAVLRMLYTQSTVDVILTTLAGLDPDPLAANRWRGLIDVDQNSDGTFKTYGSYAFPNPEKTTTARVEIVKALAQAFLPLTERPVVMSLVAEDADLRTSPAKPKLDGAGADPSPMVRKRTSGASTIVRFTDYTLDGASRNIYFFFTRQITPSMHYSDQSGVLGPVRLINSFPPPAPKVGRVRSYTSDTILKTPPFTHFEVAPYLASEGITKVKIYRGYVLEESHSIKSMKELDPVPFPSDGIVYDYFTDEAPRFGRPIYYRIVALREILNEHGESEYIPSIPSELAVVSIMDVSNPEPPAITPSSTPVGTPVERLDDVSLSWPQTTYGGTYHLYRMGDKGLWTRVASYKPTDELDVTHQVGTLVKLEDGVPLYHRFKVVAENSSGLLSLEEKILVI